MVKNTKKLIANKPKYSLGSLVNKNEEKTIKDQRIAFSFFHYQQIDLFGIGNCPTNWHIGLIERISNLSKLTLSQLLEENAGSQSLRFHRLDWSIKGVPINRTDLNWLPEEILENNDEFPIYQIAISIGTGRIIGFFDRTSSIFNVILLDPNHNI